MECSWTQSKFALCFCPNDHLVVSSTQACFTFDCYHSWKSGSEHHCWAYSSQVIVQKPINICSTSGLVVTPPINSFSRAQTQVQTLPPHVKFYAPSVYNGVWISEFLQFRWLPMFECTSISISSSRHPKLGATFTQGNFRFVHRASVARLFKLSKQSTQIFFMIFCFTIAIY